MATADVQESEHYGFWFIECILLITFPIILVCEMYMTVLISLPQTLADGSSVINGEHGFLFVSLEMLTCSSKVYITFAALSFWLILPLAPFAHKIHRYVSLVFLVVFVIMLLDTLLAFPFSQTSPLKVFFKQDVDLDKGSNKVSLTGVPGYLNDHIMSSIPSTWNQSITCHAIGDRPGLSTCSWEGLLPSITDPEYASEAWISFNVSLAAPGTALIKIRGQNTRACRIYFDQPISSIRVENTTGEVQPLYPFSEHGITQLRLWSREWNKEFVVTASWVGQESLMGRIGCGWAESQNVAAFNEVLGFLPSWATVSKQDDALVEATANFKV
jgi:hypothetical protein